MANPVAEVEQTGLCKQCSFGFKPTGRCKYHDMKSLNYRGVPDGLCALYGYEIMTLGRLAGLRVSKLQGLAAESIQPLSAHLAEHT